MRIKKLYVKMEILENHKNFIEPIVVSAKNSGWSFDNMEKGEGDSLGRVDGMHSEHIVSELEWLDIDTFGYILRFFAPRDYEEYSLEDIFKFIYEDWQFLSEYSDYIGFPYANTFTIEALAGGVLVEHAFEWLFDSKSNFVEQCLKEADEKFGERSYEVEQRKD